MQARLTLPQSERLKSRTRIEHLFKEGKSGFAYPLRYMVVEELGGEQTPGIALLVSVSKRNHKRAYRRNRLKRRMREAYRLHKAEWAQQVQASGKSLSLALLYTSNEVLDYQAIEHAVRKVIDTLKTDW